MGDRAWAFLRTSTTTKGFPWHTGREQHTLVRYRPRSRQVAATKLPVDIASSFAMAPGVNAVFSVLFTPAYVLVQELLSAKRDLQLPRALRKLDLFEVILLDDLGYVQQSRDEAEVLSTLLAERYERRSVMVTSNLVFSQWDRIFRDQMATAAAIDRLVHHAVILEVDVPSYRTDCSRPTPPASAPPASRRGRATGPLLPKRRR